MKVKDLIEKLGECNPECVVKMHYHDSDDILFVVDYSSRKDVVVLESEDNIDLGHEIEATLKMFFDEEWNECDVYYELDKKGFTPEMFYEYYGEEEMRFYEFKFREYGLGYDDIEKIEVEDLDESDKWIKINVNHKPSKYDIGYYVQSKIPQFGDIVYLCDYMLENSLFTMNVVDVIADFENENVYNSYMKYDKRVIFNFNGIDYLVFLSYKLRKI